MTDDESIDPDVLQEEILAMEALLEGATDKQLKAIVKIMTSNEAFEKMVNAALDAGEESGLPPAIALMGLCVHVICLLDRMPETSQTAASVMRDVAATLTMMGCDLTVPE